VVSAETVIPANATDKSHFYTSVATFTPTGGKVGAYLCMALKRIASTGTAPTSNPWILAVGVHYEGDTLGTRTISAK
jgi:expansin (peptidoglycan-binding protein)